MTHDSSALHGFVIDTDVVSYRFKGNPHAEKFRSILENNAPHAVVSFMTIAELDRWTLERDWGERRRRELEDYLSERFLIHDEMSRDLCRKWAEITHHCKRDGREIKCADAWIAATAVSLGLPLLTNNTKDYSAVDDLRLIIPGEE